MPNQRVRDPLHNLVEFSKSELERTLWKVIQTRPFQRLRRVKQLGFSDLIYPGASHSRLSHSLGVFHTARQLMEVVRRSGIEEQLSKEQKALAAALVHDLGHGPFSHAFEKVGKRLGLKFADHEVMSDYLIREGEVATVLDDQFGGGFAAGVADIIKKDGVKTVHHAVVSSQFDADRLDYIRRDRLMSGTQTGSIDLEWLIANLEIGNVATGVDDRQVGTVKTFVLGPKAIHAAEAFILGLFQLYPTVYFHKTTRGAEQIFAELLVRAVKLVQDGSSDKVGLPINHPLISFAKKPDDIEVALALDDAVVWGALTQMSEAKDPLISDFARRLRDRKLYKCHDVRTKVSHALDPRCSNSDEIIDKIDRCCAGIVEKLSGERSKERDGRPCILTDVDKRSPYKSVSESKGPLDQINVKTEGGTLVDLRERSSVVAALKTFKLFRVYMNDCDDDSRRLIDRIVDGEIKACRA